MKRRHSTHTALFVMITLNLLIGLSTSAALKALWPYATGLWLIGPVSVLLLSLIVIFGSHALLVDSSPQTIELRSAPTNIKMLWGVATWGIPVGMTSLFYGPAVPVFSIAALGKMIVFAIAGMGYGWLLLSFKTTKD